MFKIPKISENTFFRKLPASKDKVHGKEPAPSLLASVNSESDICPNATATAKAPT